MTLEEIYLDNYPIVFGYLLSLCGDPVEAEELTAQTFFKAVENIRRYDKTCKPSTWLCTIARNLYFNECKRKKRHVSLDEARMRRSGTFSISSRSTVVCLDCGTINTSSKPRNKIEFLYSTVCGNTPNILAGTSRF